MAKKLINSTVKLGQGTLLEESLQEYIQSGSVYIQLDGPSGSLNGNNFFTGRVVVTFKAPFNKIPSVTVTAGTSAPFYVSVSSESVTKTGFILNLSRYNTVGTGVNWIATIL